MSEKLPENTPYEVNLIVPEALKLSSNAVSSFEQTLSQSGMGTIQIKAVKDITPDEIANLPLGFKRALKFSQSVIVDAGIGIGALIEATPRNEQEFSTSEVNRALFDSGLIPEGRVMKMGASGAVVENGRGAEVIEITIFDTANRVTSVMSKTKAAWTDGSQNIHVTDLDTDRRVLLENEFLVVESDMKGSNALAIQIDVESNNVDLYQLLAHASSCAGFTDYTVRCTIEGPIKAKIAIIKELPSHRISTIEGVNDVLKAHEIVTNGTFHFTGTRSAQVSRKNEQWGEITGDNIYSPKGHYHGYSVDRSVGGHILEIIPQIGAKVMMIVEPAKVAQIVTK